jgi:hypothetical protein
MCAFVYMYLRGHVAQPRHHGVDDHRGRHAGRQRHRGDREHPPLRADRVRIPKSVPGRGANEVALAVTASTLTTIVVFLPMFYLETGEMAVYMRQFAGPGDRLAPGKPPSWRLPRSRLPLRHMHRPRLWSAAADPSTPGRALARLVDRRAARVLVSAHVFRGFLAVYEACLRWTLRSRAAAVLLIVAIGIAQLLRALPEGGRPADAHRGHAPDQHRGAARSELRYGIGPAQIFEEPARTSSTASATSSASRTSSLASTPTAAT